jgi:hypothetical protein
LDDDEKGVHTVDTPGGPQEIIIVSELGLYKLIQTSRKPAAKRFDRWEWQRLSPEQVPCDCYRAGAHNRKYDRYCCIGK